MKRLQALILLFLLAVMPFGFLVYTEYRIDASGLRGWELTTAKAGGEFDNPWSSVFTLCAFLWASTVVFLTGAWKYWLARSTSVLVGVFFLFLVTVVATSVVVPDSVPADIGRVLRYTTYFFLVPALVVVAGSSLRSIVIPVFVSYLVLSLLIVVPEFNQIRWSRITYARDVIGAGGSASATGAAFLGMACTAFLCNGVYADRRKRASRASPTRAARIVLGWSVVAASVFCIIITFSRGALAALLVMGVTYYMLRILQRAYYGPVLLFAVISLLFILGIALDDLLIAAVTRQGQLEQIDAGRREIWSAVLTESLSSLRALVFGGEREAVEAPAHNMFLGILFDHGMLALISYVVFHVAAIRVMLKHVYVSREVFQLLPRDVIVRSVATAIGILFFANFENTFFLNITPMSYLYYALVGLFVAADGYASQRRAKQARSSPQLGSPNQGNPLGRSSLE